MSFAVDLDSIYDLVRCIDPIKYGKTRNFIDGAVTQLSPYISRGVISTRMIMDHVLKNYQPKSIEKFLQELAWRDYWQQVWIEKEDQINNDLKRDQPRVYHFEMPVGLKDAETGIIAVDQAIRRLYSDGYIHNHARMYIASLACNVAQSHWKVPAQWMYYHLIDGDWASNALSWQWVAGANANKKYYANQENINKYCYTNQKGTFLDVSYKAFEQMQIPDVLVKTIVPEFKTPLPKKNQIELDLSKPTLIYNYYNLDPNWHKNEEFNRVLLLEPSVFKSYPISKNSVDFMLGLCKNIDAIQVFVGEFDELLQETSAQKVIYKEHPLNKSYQGQEESRDWMFSVKGYFPSFFAYWKKCKKELVW